MFDTYDIIRLPMLARKAERAGDWEEAKKLWRQYGSESDVKAIESIQEAIRKGDEFRRLVSEMQAERKTDDEIYREVDQIVYNR